jgi:hypothetical protein
VVNLNAADNEYVVVKCFVSGEKYFGGIRVLTVSPLDPSAPLENGGILVNDRGKAVGVVIFKDISGGSTHLVLPINKIKFYLDFPAKMGFEGFLKENSQADTYALKGTQAFFNNELAQALNYYKQALAIRPDSVIFKNVLIVINAAVQSNPEVTGGNR